MIAFDDSLYAWKEREETADVLILLQDNPLLKYAGLWRASMVRRMFNPFDGTWAALWECVDVDYAMLADMADDTEARARFQVRRLRELRLIYPDGSRTEAATAAVIKFIAHRMA